ncbi:unnamed protein product [Durusdinium trenchii]|uniref:Uncharacterized protein n=2 Tax=Durusdinium trenchii TaxID=1381693 RepID=A0ABP0MGP9_9DINO
MFKGTAQERQELLKSFVQSGCNLDAVNSQFETVRKRQDTLHSRRRMLTVRQMRELNFSEPKIQGCVARGGVPDPDAPNCRESTRYWAYVEGEEEQVDSTSATTTVSAVLRPQDALQAFGVNNSPMATVHVPGPAALARQAIGMPVETPAAPAVPAPPVPRAKAKAKAKTKPGMLPNPLSGVQLAGKTVAEKVAMASLSLRAEVKKELTALGSLKLDLGDIARFKSGILELDSFNVALTGHFKRQHAALVLSCWGCLCCKCGSGWRKSKMRPASALSSLMCPPRPVDFVACSIASDRSCRWQTVASSEPSCQQF